MHTDNLSSSTRHVIKVSKLQKCFSTLQDMRGEVSFHMFLKKMAPYYLEKERF